MPPSLPRGAVFPSPHAAARPADSRERALCSAISDLRGANVVSHAFRPIYGPLWQPAEFGCRTGRVADDGPPRPQVAPIGNEVNRAACFRRPWDGMLTQAPIGAFQTRRDPQMRRPGGAFAAQCRRDAVQPVRHDRNGTTGGDRRSAAGVGPGQPAPLGADPLRDRGAARRGQRPEARPAADLAQGHVAGVRAEAPALRDIGSSPCAGRL